MVPGTYNVLAVSLVVLVVIWAYAEGMSGLAMFAFLEVLSNLVTVKGRIEGLTTLLVV